jgi:hypothetical protein
MTIETTARDRLARHLMDEFARGVPLAFGSLLFGF